MDQLSQNVSPSRRRIKKRWIGLALLVSLVAGVVYIVSPRRDLEAALGVKHLPGSLRHEEIKVDAWTDYSVRASFEIDPDDLRRVLESRPYQKTAAPPLALDAKAPLADAIARQQFLAWFPMEVNPALGKWEPAWKYEILKDEPIFRCSIFVSRDFSKACILYVVD